MDEEPVPHRPSGPKLGRGSRNEPTPESAVSAHLEKILGSHTFASTERMRALLRHLATKSLRASGAGDDLKESVIGVEVFGRDPGYDTKIDGIVRVEVHRLRARLRQFYEAEDPCDGIRLRIDKGSYVVRVDRLDGGPVTRLRRLRWVHWAAAGAVAIVGVAGLAWRLNPAAVEPPVLRQLTADSGLTTEPSLSSDGRTIVYASDRNTSGNLLLWRQDLESGEAAQITTGSQDDHEPWISPDGKLVVYRSQRDGGGIYRVPVSGGVPELIVREGLRPRYSPDGAWILYWVSDERFAPGRAYIVPAAGGEPKRLAPDFADAHNPVWSADGKAILFCGTRVSNDPSQEHDWWVLPFPHGSAVKTGAAEAFDRLSSRFGGALRARGDRLGTPLDWRDDGLVFSASPQDVSTLWKVPVDAGGRLGGAPERLTYGTSTETWASWQGRRIVFASGQQQLDIYAAPADTIRGVLTDRPHRLTTFPSPEMQPSLSPDGDLLAYTSERDGLRRAWILDLRLNHERSVSPIARRTDRVVFSPDETQIAFLAMDGPRMRIHIEGLAARGARLLNEDAGAPTSWSPDGKWILFEPGLPQPVVGLLEVATGEKRTLVTRPGWGLRGARVSPDGRWVAVQAELGAHTRKVMIVPFRPHGTVDQFEWIDVSGTGREDFLPAWSPDGHLLYFVSERDGRRCVWAQRLHATTRRPDGAPFRVLDVPEARRTLLQNYRIGIERIGLQVGANQIVLAMDDTTSNIWVAEWK